MSTCSIIMTLQSVPYGIADPPAPNPAFLHEISVLRDLLGNGLNSTDNNFCSYPHGPVTHQCN